MVDGCPDRIVTLCDDDDDRNAHEVKGLVPFGMPSIRYPFVVRLCVCVCLAAAKIRKGASISMYLFKLNAKYVCICVFVFDFFVYVGTYMSRPVARLRI